MEIRGENDTVCLRVVYPSTGPTEIIGGGGGNVPYGDYVCCCCRTFDMIFYTHKTTAPNYHFHRRGESIFYFFFCVIFVFTLFIKWPGGAHDKCLSVTTVRRVGCARRRHRGGIRHVRTILGRRRDRLIIIIVCRARRRPRSYVFTGARAGVIWCLICSADSRQTRRRWGGLRRNARDASRGHWSAIAAQLTLTRESII